MKSDTWRAGEIERLRNMQRAMASPQATASSPFESMDFCNRVLVRAERYNKLISELDNPLPKPEEPAKVKWDAMVEKIMESEQIDRPAALKIARQRRPDLLEAMKRQANAKAGRS